MSGGIVRWGWVVWALASAPGVLSGQDLPFPEVTPGGGEVEEASATEDEDRITPRGAFIRSMIVPGWGHAAVGAQGRGGIYFLAQGASLWMVFHSHGLRGAAREMRRAERVAAEARLREAGVTDPVELRDGVEADPRVVERRELEETRSQQVEDWTALSVFLLFLISADAFVSAHLMEFPEPLSVQVAPGDALGRMEVGVSLPDHLFHPR